MPHRIEVAPSGRAKCRACKRAIGKGELRLGVAVPNAFGEGDSLHWFHLLCGSERRSKELLEALDGPPESLAEAEGSPSAEEPSADEPSVGSGPLDQVKVPEEEQVSLRQRAQIGLAHPRWTRPARAERATTGRAKCRHCHETIAGGSVRIQLEFVEDGMINPAGFLHPACASSYLGATEFILERLTRSSDLSPEELTELEQGLKVEGTPGAQAPEQDSET